MRTNLLVLAVAVLGLFTGFFTRQFIDNPWIPLSNTTEASPFIHPPLHDLEGQSQNLDRWKGKVLVINFWASWCSPCREEMPLFVSIQNEYGSRNLQFIGIAIDDPEEVMSYLSETPVNYPILLSDESLVEWADSLGNRSNVLPFSVLVDSQGKIISSHIGGLNRESLLSWIQSFLS